MKNFTVVLALSLMTVAASGQPAQHRANSVENRNPDNNYIAAEHGYKGGREVAYHYPTPPKPREYRRIYEPYRIPVSFSFYWTPEARFEYIRLYPAIHYNKYPVGYRIDNVSAYDALHYRGELANVYGKVYEVYYSRYSDEYIFYFGAYFPYHDFTAVVPGHIARKYSPWPLRYFVKEHMIITGLVVSNEGIPEINVRTEEQIRQY